MLCLPYGARNTLKVSRKKRLFGISQGQGVGLPNLLGARCKEPEQVRDSNTSPPQTPRDPKNVIIYQGAKKPGFSCQRTPLPLKNTLQPATLGSWGTKKPGF